MKYYAQPNILYIITDQQTAHLMSCSGTDWISTPNIDRIAQKGIRFERSYCSNPVCIPSRFSLFTGRYPEAIGMRSNDYKYLPKCDENILRDAMGHTFARGGYDCFFAGKQHFPGYVPDDIGFTVVTRDERDELAKTTASFLRDRHDKPWMYVASFINPHDICYKALADSLEADDAASERIKKSIEYKTMKQFDCIPEGISDKIFYKELCPPLPNNHEEQTDKPEILDQFMNQRSFKKKAAANYTKEDWRMHRYIYTKLTEEVDKQIGTVLDALEESEYADNTIIIFTSDHGDMDGSHKFEHKTVLYEEAIHIPLLISHPDGLPQGVTTDVLCSNSIDLYPSLLEYVGIDVPKSLKYINCIDAALGTGDKRKYLAVESEIGRAIISEKLKYVMYDFGEHNEQLYDYDRDPDESCNHIFKEDLHKDLSLLRNEFNQTWSEEVRRDHKSPLLITDYSGKV